jgi:hypothetical protein
MKLIDVHAPSSSEPAQVAMDDIIGDLFHEAQNGVHLVGMELELVSMGLGNSSDAVKTAGIVKRLENTLRDLRGYVSVLQDPCATCDPAVVLDGVVAGLRSRKRNNRLELTTTVPESLPVVLAHPKLLARILERVFEFCENLLHQGGDLRIRAASGHVDSQIYAEINLTMLSPMDIADEELCGNRFVKGGSNRGIERALEVLRRHRGQMIFRRHSDRQCELNLRILASPKESAGAF